ncbi:HNH endonuclease [Antarcticirhabdus aurantiaca]|uniref:HNH endonuclease n=1 Tax=Antarcticirhabdus aurantiaca TaxID=2606717 RepID=UPI00131BAFA1|nr:HNH endonuclease [Antarcticirhabdus aurantiaca]
MAIHNGHVFKKVANARRWKLLSHLNWEEANGPLPEGYVLKARDGDRLNTDASNWVLFPNWLGVTARLAIHNAPPELMEAVILNETVKHRLRLARARAGLPDPIARRVIREIEIRRQQRHAKRMEEDPVYREQHKEKVRSRYLTQKQNRALRMAADPEYAAARRESLRRKDKRRRDRKRGVTT